MSALTKQYIKELNEGVKNLFNSNTWRDYLTFLSKFHAYSVNNTIAIFSQRPEATLVASFTDWKKRGRSVRKGERGIQIIAPHTYKEINPQTGEEENRLAFHLAHCFDVSQTTGKDLPESPCHMLVGNVTDYIPIREALCQIAPVYVEFKDINNSANGYFDRSNCVIVVKDSLSELQTVKTLIHEIAHALLHAKGADEENADMYSREVQAESVAYVVCRYLGLNTSDYSFGYIAGWSKDQSLEELKASIEAINRTSDQIIKNIESITQQKGDTYE